MAGTGRGGGAVSQSANAAPNTPDSVASSFGAAFPAPDGWAV